MMMIRSSRSSPASTSSGSASPSPAKAPLPPTCSMSRACRTRMVLGLRSRSAGWGGWADD
eukprot:3154691-Rhodomonas_salina.2